MKKRIIIIVVIVVLSGLAIFGLIGNDKTSPESSLPIPTIAPFVPGSAEYIAQKEIVKDPQKEFTIVYDPNSDLYIISILNKPFDTIRLLAEQELVKSLKISEQDACKLKVSIGSPHFANPEQTETFTTFSFCPK